MTPNKKIIAVVKLERGFLHLSPNPHAILRVKCQIKMRERARKKHHQKDFLLGRYVA